MKSPAGLLVGLLCCLCACQAPPAALQLAEQANLHSELRQGGLFQHRIIAPRTLLAGQQAPSSLTVFIEGDGRPWRHGYYVARQPDGRRPLALELMLTTDQPSLYLGRPCYLGQERSTGCDPVYWTSHRYSADVVASLLVVLKQLLAELGNPPLRLVGYSGGGAIATLMASELPAGSVVVTLAGNLDIDGWSKRHAYLPLAGSLNPIVHADMARVRHHHYVGAEDHNVPAALVEGFRIIHGGRVTIIEQVDHRCCWLEHWSTSINSETALPVEAAQAKVLEHR